MATVVNDPENTLERATHSFMKSSSSSSIGDLLLALFLRPLETRPLRRFLDKPKAPPSPSSARCSPPSPYLQAGSQPNIRGHVLDDAN